ncbi:dihydroorotate dehydrogenase electron transfer subunit [Candidatus Peregrinibacteria bacterium RIFOXYC2_FULL_33_13]|nr:MAG: dihydroorotate dehydrogenase electron transfer subunit [Candidatus Peregrinibacteria bacterium RIFOXYA2_FULL_33_7]OGJ53534.1 MAG: dihydroorotate dehydrogenase electron transfer subunit [Candidatus Peregrinibacteria bacterium RIFOXYC2_FULL_33_13]
MDKPKVLQIKDIRNENEFIKTFVFEYPLNSKPGQFVMLWLPEMDEKPFSTSYDDGKEFWITVFKVGKFTEKLFDLKVGDQVGIRGPYGNGFKLKVNQHLVMVGGGCGSAPLFSTLREAKEKNCKVDFVLGARTSDLLLFQKRIKDFDNIDLHVCTDDGSEGEKGFTTDVLKRILDEKIVDMILSCGPEVMMKKVSEIAFEKSVKAQLSLERYMKCGFGICGNCTLDPTGLRVCKDGPIFDNEILKNVADFGAYHRDSEGKKEWFGACKVR